MRVAVWLGRCWSPPPCLWLSQEGLYEEEMPKKVRATGMIAQLFRATENFEVGPTGGGRGRWAGQHDGRRALLARSECRAG